MRTVELRQSPSRPSASLPRVAIPRPKGFRNVRVDGFCVRGEKTFDAARGVNAICAFDVEEQPTIVQRIAGEQDPGFWFENRNQSRRMARRMHDRNRTTAEVDPIAVFGETCRRSGLDRI